MARIGSESGRSTLFSPLRPKPVRKGTRSCIECAFRTFSQYGDHELAYNRRENLGRRRKVRCYFIRGDSVCSPCVIRGSQCIDQRESIKAASRVSPPASHTSPEAEVAKRQHPLPSSNPQLNRHSDINPQAGETDQRIPLVSVLHNARVCPNTLLTPCTINPESNKFRYSKITILNYPQAQ